MKILSSSPYATFNPKEWNSLSRANLEFYNSPIKTNKKFFSAFKSLKSTKKSQENNGLPKQMQIAFT